MTDIKLYHRDCLDILPNPIAFVESKFNITLNHKSGDEWAGPCPWCGGIDRWLFWPERGNFMCRPGDGHCGKKGFVDELMDTRLTNVERRLLAVEAEQRRAKREREQTEKRLSALERMKVSTKHIEYHQSLDVDAVRYWHSQGITDESIRKYMLGYCESCPTARGHASYTIPYFASDGKTLLNIEHRLTGITKGDRYRPHAASLGKQLYNSAIVGNSSELVAVEGAKKCIALAQETFPAIGVQGSHGFDIRWLPHFKDTRILYIAFDPDAMGAAHKLGQDIAKASSIDVRIVSLPTKPDDFFWLFSGTANMFNEYLRYARRVR